MILVTGANRQLASLTLLELHAQGIATIGGTRKPGSSECLIDFDDPVSLDFTRIDTLVLTSAGYAEDDRVIARHAAVVSAAMRDGVTHIIYTSLVGAGDHLGFALAHRATEHLIRESDLEWTFLRNGLYAELFGGLMSWKDGALETPFGDGRIAAVARGDLAAAAATVASDPHAHAGRTYELTSPSIDATQVAEHLGVPLQLISLGEYRSRLLSDPGLLPLQPPMLASIATSIRHDFLSESQPDLTILLRSPLTDTVTVAASAAKSLRP
ncbi:NAD(P)H-binding protein [Kocuria carniphila]|uniref:NAD(P)H-binding protein n=1 Tax=Kocuria carniphila TaxID=262208 RepID=A0ABV3V8T6_9MICC